MCKNGIGGPKQLGECLKWWRAAADQGCPRSQYSLAVFLVRQKDGPVDVGTIAELLRKAAAGEQADARRIVGKCGDDLSDARAYAELLIDLAEGELRRRQALATDEPSFSISLPADWKQSHDENWLLSHQPKGSQMPPAADSRKSVIPDLNRANASFSALLIKYVRDRFGGDAPSVYRAARINRKTYSAIISDELRAVSKRTAVAFALALKLSRTDADEFLRAAGFALSSSIREDMVFNACIEAGIYDLACVNQILVNHQARHSQRRKKMHSGAWREGQCRMSGVLHRDCGRGDCRETCGVLNRVSMRVRPQGVGFEGRPKYSWNREEGKDE